MTLIPASDRDRASTVHLALPKVRMERSVLELLQAAGVSVRSDARAYRPRLSLPGFETELLKPQNMVAMLQEGSRDIGFAGADWVAERGAELVELCDTGLDPVRIVAAAPEAIVVDGRVVEPVGRPLVVASEYERLARGWMERLGVEAHFVRSYGATEVFPPEDAGVIVDNTASGATLAALAFGCCGPAAHVVVGPGNRYVTAAKRCLAGEVGIDGLAGPRELLVLADGTADPAVVAADLLGQAEHDVDALPTLVTTDERLVAAVDAELGQQLATLPTAATAQEALVRNGRACIVPDLDAAVAVADALAPEHLELCVRDPVALAGRLSAYGGLFVGAGSAEVFGDYGAGPNHVLPTGRGARFQAGLSVATFPRPATFLALDDPQALIADSAALARLEGLEAHARAAEARRRR